MLPSPAQGASASSIPPQNPLLVLRPLYSECRVQWPVHGNSQRAVNRPFNTATHHTRYRATAFGLPIRHTGTTLRPVTPCAFEGHRARQGSAQTFGLSMITTPTLAGHPTGGFNGVSNARSSSRVHGPWHSPPAQAFGLVASGSTVGQYGTPADYGGLATAERWRPSCLTAGALAHGGAPARVRSRVPLDGHFKRLS